MRNAPATPRALRPAPPSARESGAIAPRRHRTGAAGARVGYVTIVVSREGTTSPRHGGDDARDALEGPRPRHGSHAPSGAPAASPSRAPATLPPSSRASSPSSPSSPSPSPSPARTTMLAARRPLLLALVAAAALALLAGAGASALASGGATFPSFLLDPYATFSQVDLPTWGTHRLGLRYPDRVIAVDGVPLGPAQRYGDYPAQRLYAHLAAARAAGRAEVALAVRPAARDPGSAGVTTVRAPLRVVGAAEVAFFFGVYAVVALFVLWSGAFVLRVAGRRPAAGAYAFWSLGTFVFLVTFFDYHTRAALAPFFSVATVSLPVAFGWLAYAFPAPPARARGLARAALITLAGCGVLAAGAFALAAPLGLSTTPLRRAVDVVMGPAIVLLALAMLARLRRSEGQARAELLSAIGGLVLLPVLIAGADAVRRATGNAAFHLLLPFLLAAVPLFIGYALARNNILATTWVLARRTLAAPIALLALLGALLLWLLARATDVLPPGGAASAVLVVGAFALLYTALERAAVRALFPARAHFRPSIEQLSDQLATRRTGEQVRDAVEAIIQRWLPTRRAQVLDADAVAATPHLPAAWREQLAAGARVWTLDTPWERQLLVPMRSLGELQAVLLLEPKLEYALFTDEDLALLDTIAGLGALALHNARTLREIERLRRLEVSATRDDKRLTIGILGAEIAHEIAYPLNYFRYLLKQIGKGAPLETADVDIGREEVERLSRMLTSMRRLQLPPPRRETVPVHLPLQRALDLLRDVIEEREVTVRVELPEGLTVIADPDPLLQLFANLLRNAVQAAGERGEVEVRARRSPDGGALWIEVLDSGPGVPDELRDAIFNPWVTTRPGGSGLGLAVTQRIVRGFGWSIALEQDGIDGRTCFRVVVPASAAREGADEPDDASAEREAG